MQRYKEHDIDIVIGETLVNGANGNRRDTEALLQSALRIGNGAVHVFGQNEGTSAERIYSEHLFCVACGLGFEELDPRLFSFNSRQGACPACTGAGFLWEFDPELIVPDESKSLKRDALLPLARSELAREKNKLLRGLKKLRVPVDRPFGELSVAQREVVFSGDSNGLQGTFAILNEALESGQDTGASYALSQFLGESACPECQGERLNPRARAVQVYGHSLPALLRLATDDCLSHLQALSLSERDTLVGGRFSKKSSPRLTFLNQVGLSYLSLDRRADTLSGGEAQRIRRRPAWL